MRLQHNATPEQLDCGCFRYCDTCTESKPSGLDLVYSRFIAESFGEAWFDVAHWSATELTSVRLGGQAS